MQYDEYGNDQGFDEQDLGGLTIQDGLGDEEELSAEELIAQAMMGGNVDLGHDEGEGEVNQSFSGVGGATAEALQLGRFSHMEYRVQAGLKAVLNEERVDGIHPVDAAAAREEFSKIIGSKDLKAFAKQMKIDESVSVTNEEWELNQVVSMLQHSSGTYMARGAGGALAGHNVFGQETEWQKENQARDDKDLVQAIEYVQEIADVYLDDRTRGSRIEGVRRQALEEAITKRMIDGTFYEGSGSILPLPNETGITGIKPTIGVFSSFQGTKEDRLSASKYDDLYQQIPHPSGKTTFVRNDQGHKVFRDDVTKEQRNKALSNTPSLANSLYPKPKPVNGQKFNDAEKAKHTRDQKFKMSQLQTKANIARKALRKETITTRDENKGNQLRMAGWDTPYGEQADLQNLRNEASILDLEWASGVDSDTVGNTDRETTVGSKLSPSISMLTAAKLTATAEENNRNTFGYDFNEEYVEFEGGLWRPSEIRAYKASKVSTANINADAPLGSGKGSDSGGLHGLTLKSEVDQFVEDRQTEEELEQTNIAASQVSPKQGTKEWLAQRKGHITASIAGSLLKDSGLDTVTYNLAREKFGLADDKFDFEGNAHTREGNDSEHKAAAAFMASKHAHGLTMEEAFFEKSDDESLAGFGVSPDGRLYDAKGKSAGLLELKYLSNDSMEGAVKKYTPQVQMQMLVTGESQTHFLALDKHTGEYVHELIQADPEMQAQLKRSGTMALERADELNIVGVQTLRKQILSKRKPRTKTGASEEVEGQQESIVLEEEFEKPMTAFQADALASAQTPKSGGIASQTLLAKKMQREEQADKMKQAMKNAKDLPTDEIELAQTKAKKEQAQARSSFIEGNARPTYLDAKELAKSMSKEELKESGLVVDNTLSEMASYYKGEESADRAKTKEEAQVRRMAAAETAAYEEDFKRATPSREVKEVTNLREQAKAKNTFVEGNERPDFDVVTSGISSRKDKSGELSEMASYYKEEQARAKIAETEMGNIESEAYAENKEFDKKATQADKDTAKAAEDASKALRGFGNEVKKAGDILGTLYDLIKEGSASAMTTSQVATEANMDINKVRDLEFGITKNTDLSQPQALGLISKAGDIRSQISTASGQADFINKVMPTLAQMDVQLDYSELSGLSTTELIDTFVSKAPADPEEQRLYYETLGISDAIHLRGRTTSELAIDTRDIDLDKQREAKSDISGVEQFKQEALELGTETAGGTGGVEAAGYGALAVEVGAGVVGAYGAVKGLGKAKSIMQAAKSPTATTTATGKPVSRLAQAAKPSKLAGALKKVPTSIKGGIAGVALAGVRVVGGVEDDGGVADSIADVAEFAATGALLGSVVPGVGTAIGAGVGAAVGVANEAWEYFTADDAVPSADIGKMPMQGREDPKGGNTNVNVEVTNEISPDLIRTTTNVDGDLNVDEESNLRTGG